MMPNVITFYDNHGSIGTEDLTFTDVYELGIPKIA